jgi:hypothetical protein
MADDVSPPLIYETIPQTPFNKADVPPLDFPSGQILQKNQHTRRVIPN